MNEARAMPFTGISILGSTGSIGTNTLKVVERFKDRFRVVGLAAGRQIDRLLEQIARHRPEVVAVASADDAERVRSEFPSIRAFHGVHGMVEVATRPDTDFVMSATVGAVGLVPTLRAIEAGKTVGLANKETLVMAGELMTRAVAASGSALLPVDSEHNAVHQCLEGRKDKVKRIWLTASGGPFRLSTIEEMRRATKAEALKHPTWSMGRKISIDSATMMNKGLEIIEAHWLFGVPADRVRVVVHPQSTIHSMVELEDGSFLAQLGATDMRLPIQYALTYPERVESDLPPLDLESPLSLDFHPPDHERFPAIGLAYRALATGGTAPAALNAANEVAVEAFLNDRIGFLSIADILAETMSRLPAVAVTDLDTVLEADLRAREEAERLVARGAPVAIG
jgi:1-deoxy-D-xylulose-5-phosphate reductoisomerase